VRSLNCSAAPDYAYRVALVRYGFGFTSRTLNIERGKGLDARRVGRSLEAFAKWRQFHRHGSRIRWTKRLARRSGRVIRAGSRPLRDLFGPYTQSLEMT